MSAPSTSMNEGRILGTYRTELDRLCASTLDAMGVHYMYRPQHLKLPDGTRFVPDFYLYEKQIFLYTLSEDPSESLYRIQTFARANPYQEHKIVQIGDHSKVRFITLEPKCRQTERNTDRKGETRAFISRHGNLREKPQQDRLHAKDRVRV